MDRSDLAVDRTGDVMVLVYSTSHGSISVPTTFDLRSLSAEFSIVHQVTPGTVTLKNTFELEVSRTPLF